MNRRQFIKTLSVVPFVGLVAKTKATCTPIIPAYVGELGSIQSTRWIISNKLPCIGTDEHQYIYECVSGPHKGQTEPFRPKHRDADIDTIIRDVLAE